MMPIKFTGTKIILPAAEVFPQPEKCKFDIIDTNIIIVVTIETMIITSILIVIIIIVISMIIFIVRLIISILFNVTI